VKITVCDGSVTGTEVYARSKRAPRARQGALTCRGGSLSLPAFLTPQHLSSTQQMKTPSPTLEGFGAILHRPACGLAEIAWRWTFGFAAGSLIIFSVAEYLNTLTISPAQLFLLKTHHPILVLQTLAAIFRGSAGRVASAVVVLVLALALAWIVIASIGRASSLVSRF